MLVLGANYKDGQFAILGLKCWGNRIIKVWIVLPKTPISIKYIKIKCWIGEDDVCWLMVIFKFDIQWYKYKFYLFYSVSI